MSQNYEIIRSLLNLSSAKVDDIQMFSGEDKIITVRLESSFSSCPFCGSHTILSNGYYSRMVNILGHLFSNIKVHINVKRFRCKDCHHSFSNSGHMPPRNSVPSYATIQQIMEPFKFLNITFSQAASVSNLSTTTVIRLFDRYCHVQRASFPEAICIDEVYTKNTDFKSSYSSLIYNFDKRTLVDVLPSRRKSYLHHYFQSISKDELDSVRYVCMDMYDTYRRICQTYFKKATICVDSFHVVKHINDDLSRTRIRVMNAYTTDSIEYYLLKNFNFLLLDRSVELENETRFNRRLNRYINYS